MGIGSPPNRAVLLHRNVLTNGAVWPCLNAQQVFCIASTLMNGQNIERQTRDTLDTAEATCEQEAANSTGQEPTRTPTLADVL